MNELDLGEHIAALAVPRLSFANHMHGFIARDGTLRPVPGPELLLRSDAPLDRPVILLVQFVPCA